MGLSYLKWYGIIGIMMQYVYAVEVYGPYDIYAMMSCEAPRVLSSSSKILAELCIINISVAYRFKNNVNMLQNYGVRLRRVKKVDMRRHDSERNQNERSLNVQKRGAKRCNDSCNEEREKLISFYENCYTEYPDKLPPQLLQNTLHSLAWERVCNTKKTN